MEVWERNPAIPVTLTGLPVAELNIFNHVLDALLLDIANEPDPSTVLRSLIATTFAVAALTHTPGMAYFHISALVDTMFKVLYPSPKKTKLPWD